MIRLLISALLVLPLALPAAAAPDTDKLNKRLQQLFPGRKIEELQPSPIDGFYQVTLEGNTVYTDGKYLLQGDIYDLETMSNLTKLNLMESISVSNTVVFAPEDKTKHTVTVFTDTTCGYCRRLHQEVGALTDAGVKVRYMLYPRAGADSGAAKTLESVWCSDNPPQAMTAAKAGQQIPEKSCDNPINEHIEMAHRLGLRGTPLIVTDNGTVIPGYKPADQLIQQLESQPQ